jgi:hypothetical protein
MPRLPKPKKNTTAFELEQRLADRYCPNEWAFLPQVGSGTGVHYRRTADAIALNLWPSRGMELLGFEIKVARYDWLRELKDPEKSVEVQGYCDRWYIVAPEGVVEDGELPPTWGLMVPRGKGVRIMKEAPKLEAKPLDRTFIAAVMRQALKVTTPQAKLDAKFMEGKREGIEVGEGKFVRNQLNGLKKAIYEFQAASGVRIDDWQAGRIGRAVKEVLDRPDPIGILERQSKMFRQMADRIDEAAVEIKKEAGS